MILIINNKFLCIGDYHFSDIKALLPGNQLYSKFYDSPPTPLYQIMASGMSTSTGINYTCDSYRLDPFHLRTHPECNFVRGPSFGMIDIDYKYYDNDHRSKNDNIIDTSKYKDIIGISKIKLQIRDGKKANKILLELIIDPNTCNP